MHGTATEVSLGWEPPRGGGAAARDLPHVVLSGGRAAASFPDGGGEGDAGWRDIGAAYARMADAYVRGASGTLHLVVVDARDHEAPGRSVVLAMEHGGVASAVGAATGSRPHFLDHLVLLDGRRGPGAPPTESEVACDIGQAVADLYPLEATGPATHLLPPMLRLAAGVALAGAGASKGWDRGIAAEDAELGAALAAAVVREAARLGGRLRLPVERDELAHAAQTALARAMESLGGSVSRDRAKAKAA